MFITYSENGKLLSKQSSSSPEFFPFGDFIEITDDNWEIELDKWRLDIQTKELIELPPKPADGYEFDYTTLEWKPNLELIKSLVNNSRQMMLQRSDWTDTVSAQTRLPNYAEWQTYRQALRDIPNQSGYPFNVIWPEQPL